MNVIAPQLAATTRRRSARASACSSAAQNSFKDALCRRRARPHRPDGRPAGICTTPARILLLTALISEDDNQAPRALPSGIRCRTPLPTSTRACKAARWTPSISPCRITCTANTPVRAAEAGVHVLCEKPMAVTAAECEKMLHATDAANVKLMIAYRLHFETANLKAIGAGQIAACWATCGSFPPCFAIDVQDRQRPARAGKGRRHAVRHWHLLHQCRPLPLRRRADRRLRASRPIAASLGLPRSTK